MRNAQETFNFVEASHLIRICPQRARTLRELAENLRTCSEACIFHHTFHSPELHLESTFPNDFARWVFAACNEAILAERMAAIDLREFVSLEELRQVLAQMVEDQISENHHSGDRPAFEPFHFCETVEVSVRLEANARNLVELANGIRQLSLDSLHYHFINSRLRLRLRTNDFSYWIENSLKMPKLAKRLDDIDFYIKTLEAVRAEILDIIESAVEP